MYVIKVISHAPDEASTLELIYEAPTHLWRSDWRGRRALKWPALDPGFTPQLSLPRGAHTRLLGLPTERQSLPRTSFWAQILSGTSSSFSEMKALVLGLLVAVGAVLVSAAGPSGIAGHHVSTFRHGRPWAGSRLTVSWHEGYCVVGPNNQHVHMRYD